MKKKVKLKRKKLFLYVLFFLLIILSAIYIINVFKLKKESLEESQLLNTVEIQDKQLAEETAGNIQHESTEKTQEEQEESGQVEEMPKQTERMLKVEKLQEENADIVGWLEIEDTSINYPVLQGTDNEYYMTHNYKKQKSKNGSIFLTKDYDWSIPSSNLLIYGHNMNNGTMFQELLKYEKESFYKQHPVIRFTTENEDAEYEIIAVLKTRVFYKSEKNVFRYYYFVNAETEEEYNVFVENAKKESLYSIDKTAKFGEQLITLSTCSYHVKDGRFAVIGRKVESCINL